MKLYHRPDCPFCWKVRIFLLEEGIDVDETVVELDQRHPDVIALNPAGTVPVLCDGGLVISDSALIIEYLADKFPPSRLMAGSPEQRAEIRRLHKMSDTIVGQLLFPQIKRVREGGKDTLEAGQTTREDWINIQRSLSNTLAGNEFFSGCFSAAECALFPRVALAHVYGLPLDDEFQNLKEWFNRCVQRSSVLDSLPRSFPGVDEMIKPENFAI